MVKFVRVKQGNSFKYHTVVESETPAKEMHPTANRAQRRDAVYANPVRRLIEKIGHIRREMIGSGIEPAPFPRFLNKKALSGHMSQLVAQATA